MVGLVLLAVVVLIPVPSCLLDALEDTAGWNPFLHTGIGRFSANAEDPVKPPTSGRTEPVSGRPESGRYAASGGVPPVPATSPRQAPVSTPRVSISRLKRSRLPR